MSKPIITTSEDGYTLTIGDESTDVIPFGTPLEVDLAGKRWLAYIDLPEGSDESSDFESVLENWLYEVTPVMDEDIEFEEDEDDADDAVEVTVPDDDDADDDDD